MLLLVGRMVFENAEDLRQLQEFRLEQLLLLYGLFVVYLFLRAYSSYIILHSVESVEISLGEWIKIFAIGRFANTLFAQSGNLYRATVLKEKHQLSFSGYVNVQAFFVWLETLASLGMALLLALWSHSTTRIAGFRVTIVLGLLMIVVFIGPIFAKQVLDKWGCKSGTMGKINRLLDQMLSFVLNRGTDLSLIARVTIIDLGLFVTWGLLYRTTFLSMGIEIGLGDLALFLAVYKLSTFLVITPGNMGVREAAYALLGQAVGISMAQGVIVSAVLRITGYTILFPVGFLWGGSQLFGIRQQEKNPHHP
jgi:uncharacterized membrane protein YbhN (UPF0104 family)